MKIGVDFDRVLFKTDEFKELLKTNLDGFEETYEEAHDSKGNYDWNKHVSLMDINREDYLDVFDRCSEFVYEDVKKLEKLKKEGFELFIVSRGEEKFQKFKIEKSSVSSIFDDVFIIEEGQKDQVDIDFLVDDLEKEIKDVNVPGMIFDREKHSIDDLVQRVRKEF